MSSSVQAYWAAVKKEAAALPNPFYYVMSLDDPTRGMTGGCVVEVSRSSAAELIVKRSHRIATDAEIEAVSNGRTAEVKPVQRRRQ